MYQVKLGVFDGPLDLLLHLIKRNKIDVYEIFISRITKEYLEYLDLMKELNLSFSADFLAIAAQLIQIKSRRLLPQLDSDSREEDESDSLTEESLLKKLLEPGEYREVALELELRDKLEEQIYPVTLHKEGTEVEKPVLEVSLFDLMDAFREVLKKAKESENRLTLATEEITVGQRMKQVLDIFASEKRLSLSQLLLRSGGRSRIIITFLAILELIRLKKIFVYQEKLFTEIWVERRTNYRLHA
ncbi:MAG: segregation/condensation protein A [bacterium]|nr:segregation/condensation protein A [bacterium]